MFVFIISFVLCAL